MDVEAGSPAIFRMRSGDGCCWSGILTRVPLSETDISSPDGLNPADRICEPFSGKSRLFAGSRGIFAQLVQESCLDRWPRALTGSLGRARLHRL